ncbi:MAG: 16S rRNA (adenine(1518)-N(6)/adenine(1519)-N(6))-dimethyltransferase RsmA [Bacteroidota bacterium]
MIAPKKTLGQNFLRDENIARNIVKAVHPRADDIVVEIGPGTGAITKYLLQGAKTVLGVELDKRAAAFLRDSYGDALTVLQANIVELDLHAVARDYSKPVRVVGNIPYHLTSEILFWLFEHRAAVHDATLMMQLEVAQRLIARPRTKEYGILSVATQFHTRPNVLFKVSRNAFSPKPKVDSALVHLAFNKELPPCDLSLFTALVRATFGKRRKTLRNGLRYMGYSEEQLGAVRFALTRRPEELSVEEFLELTGQLEQFPVPMTAHA